MNQKLITSLAVGALFSCGLLGFNNQKVNAAYPYCTTVHNSYYYNQHGERVGHYVIKTGQSRPNLGLYQLRGKKYIKVASNRFVKKSNVKLKSANKSLHLKHNAYVYNLHGHRTNHALLKKGTTRYSFGRYELNGTYYYKISPYNLFIKANNVSTNDSGVQVSTTNDSSTIYSSTGTHSESYTVPGSSKNESPKNNEKPTTLHHYPKTSKTYQRDSLRLPSGYVPNANSNSWQNFVNEGREINTFHPESRTDSRMKVNPNNLTRAQQAEISNFAIRLLNQARSQYGIGTVSYSAKTQELTNRIAQEYRNMNWDYMVKGHYLPGIIAAARSMGLNIDNNYLEDAYGQSLSAYPVRTMTDLKHLAYNGLMAMFFNSSESNHAQDLLQANLSTGSVSFGTFTDASGRNIVFHLITVPDYLNF